MAELIDKDVLVANFRKTRIDEVFPNWREMIPNTKAAIVRLSTKYREIVLSAPTIDAVPVVRCKDCKHWSMGYCKHFAYYSYEPMTNEDDFCSYGERKDNVQP